MCVREQHRSNSPTSGLCWPSSAVDTGCFRRDRPHPLSPLWARSRHHSPGRKRIHSEKRASRTRIHNLPGILSIRLIEWTSLILNASLCSWQGYQWHWHRFCLHVGSACTVYSTSEKHGCLSHKVRSTVVKIFENYMSNVICNKIACKAVEFTLT